ncbi:MAG: cell wall hydrolase [Flavonifractor plautii]
MKKFLATLSLRAVMLTGASFCVEYEPAAALEPVATPVHAVAEQVNLTEKRADIPQPVVSKAPVVQPEEPMEEPNAVTLTQEEIDLIALCVMAEAEGEPEEGQRLVIDTILNRVDDPRFPGNVHDVIYQKNQFAGMYGERIERPLCEGRAGSAGPGGAGEPHEQRGGLLPDWPLSFLRRPPVPGGGALFFQL